MSGRVKVVGTPVEAADEVLTPAALAFVTELHDRFAVRLEHLLAERQRRQDMVSVGEPLDFLPETAAVRTGGWRVAGSPDDVSNRQLIDLSDATSPTWSNVKLAQCSARDVPEAVLRPRGFHLPERHLTTAGRRWRPWWTPDCSCSITGVEVRC